MANYINPKVILQDDPQGLDLVIQSFQTAFAEGLPWLEKSFGRAYLLVDENGKKYPGIHTPNNEYISMMPNDNLGSFCFFKAETPGAINDASRVGNDFKYTISAIFFLKLDKLKMSLNVCEPLKFGIFDIIKQNPYLKEALTVSDDFTEVYKGYDVAKFEKAVKKAPFLTLKFTFKIQFLEPCN
jgi:hypothetical protein